MLIAIVAFAFRSAVFAELLIWNEERSEEIAASTDDEDLLYALIKKAARINTESQYQLMDRCYASLYRIYEGKNEIELSNKELQLLNRAFSCYLVISFSSELEMDIARQKHHKILSRIKAHGETP
jgi:hypothetical protein